MTVVDTNAVRTYIVETHADTVDAVRSCAASAATADRSTEADDASAGRSDTSAVRCGIEACLRDVGVWNELPNVLVGCVECTGGRLGASPVPAPPYVAPTATGVVLRATLGTGRLVVAVDALAVDRDGTATDSGVTLRPRSGDTPLSELVRVEWRG